MGIYILKVLGKSWKKARNRDRNSSKNKKFPKEIKGNISFKSFLFENAKGEKREKEMIDLSSKRLDLTILNTTFLF